MAAEYVKGRDFISATKMNYFHYFCKQLFGYNIHPQIHVGAQDLRIADFGTQTAAWSIDVAESSSRPVRIDGFDRSDQFFPPRAWLPKNVNLHIHDVCEPFPEHYQRKFDLVHIRLFVHLSASQITRVLNNAVDILRPGGYVQWIEHDKTDLKVVKTSSELSSDAAEAMLHVERNPFPNYNHHWTLDIAPSMVSSGLDVVADERIATRPSMLAQMNELHLIAMIDVPPGLSAKIDDFNKNHMATFIEENKNGVSTVDHFLCVVGRKVA